MCESNHLDIQHEEIHRLDFSVHLLLILSTHFKQVENYISSWNIYPVENYSCNWKEKEYLWMIWRGK